MDGGPDDAGPIACTFGAGCPGGFYCDTAGTGNNCTKGTCKPIPAVEAATRDPVCGCDDVTYWNPSVAAHNKMPVKKLGQCGNTGAQCGGLAGTACPNNAQCNHRIGPSATTPPPECNIADLGGRCWMTPTTCPTIAKPQQRACGSLSCTDECNLIKLMTPWYDDPDGCPN